MGKLFRNLERLIVHIAFSVMIILGIGYIGDLRFGILSFNGRIIERVSGFDGGLITNTLEWIMLSIEIAIPSFVIEQIIRVFWQSHGLGAVVRVIVILQTAFSGPLMCAYIYAHVWGDVKIGETVILPFYNPDTLNFGIGAQIGTVALWYVLSQCLPLLFQPRGVFSTGLNFFTSVPVPVILLIGWGEYTLSSHANFTLYQINALWVWVHLIPIDVCLAFGSLYYLVKFIIPGQDIDTNVHH